MLLHPTLGPTNAFTAFPPEAIEQSIPARFEQRVRLSPHRVAIQTADQTLTYEALNALANPIAWTLLDRLGATTEPVGLLFEQGAPLVAATLGVLKASKIYAPLDPDFPALRLTALLDDVQTRLILTHTAHLTLAQAIAPAGCQVVNIDTEVTPGATLNPALPMPPETLAYLFYTSGSTGRPKGVVHSHRTILHAIANFTNAMHACVEDRLTLFYPGSVIAATKDTLLALLNGATLCPFEVKSAGLQQLASWLRDTRITMYHSTPTLFRHLCSCLTSVETLAHLRLVRFGGETVTRRDLACLQQYCGPACLLYVSLGATETGGSIRKVFLQRDTSFSGSVVPCGYAVPDMDVRILDEHGSEVQGDGIGEIVVKSRYVAVGYWRRPDLTQAVFQADPEGSDARIYRTGDVGRLRPDGCLEHLGRQDAQVKVRGYRVEVTEIELTLLDHPLIQEAVVVARTEPSGTTRLIAYVVPVEGSAPTNRELGSFLQAQLSDYMIPATFVALPALPLTDNAKIDRLALPAPTRTRPVLSTPYRAPSTPLETLLAGIWAEVLDLEAVGVQDHFLDLGGHSVLGMQIVARVQEAVQHEVPVRLLLERPTIAQMALAITQAMVDQMPAAALADLLQAVEAGGEKGDVL